MRKAKYRLSSDKLAIIGYFAGIIAVGTFALLLPACWSGPSALGIVDALFTATSAVCVTGLTTVSTADYSRLGQIVILLLIEAGGLGLISFTTIYVMLPRSKMSLVGRNLVKDYSIDEVAHEPRAIIKTIVASTFAMEALGSLPLWLAFSRGGDPHAAFDAVFHSVSAFCNAGFSTFPRNLEGFAGDPLVVLGVCALIVLGGLGFVVLSDIMKRATGRKRRLAFYSVTVIRTTAVLVGLGFLFFLAAEWAGAYAGMGPGTKALAALFQSVTPRTAGFDTVDQGHLGPASVLATVFLMFVGGSSGSTAGGVKTSTLYILFWLAAKGTDPTNDSLVVRQRSIPQRTIVKAIRIVLKAAALVCVMALLLFAAEASRMRAAPVTLTQVLFETVSAFGTVGLSLDFTPTLGAAGKLLVAATMFMGRVGLVAMALPLPGKRIESYADFASADHIVG